MRATGKPREYVKGGSARYKAEQCTWCGQGMTLMTGGEHPQCRKEQAAYRERMAANGGYLMRGVA